MPVRIHGRLLAELGAVLGFCLAAAGCQTSAVRYDTPPLTSTSDPYARPGNSVTTYFRGDRPDGSGLAQGQVLAQSRSTAIGGDNANAASTSAWNPIQRTSGEQIEMLPAQGQTPANSPNVLRVDGQAAQQPGMDPPGQLNQPTPLVAQPVIEVPGLQHLPNGQHAPREFDKHSYPTYVIEPPDILQIRAAHALPAQPEIRIQTPVSMDGTINLGIYGLVYVAGMTVEQARDAVTEQLRKRIKTIESNEVALEVAAYNSKVYYIITDGGGYGQTVSRFPSTGNETVLDALAQIGGLPAVSSKKHIWLARATPGHSAPQIMPIDWIGLTQRGEAATNYQIFPGDRIYVSSDPWVRIDTWIARRLAPLNQLFGAALLGSTTVNSIKGTTTTSGVP
jgi:protein involved in polysaccharide export with SLBB domain